MSCIKYKLSCQFLTRCILRKKLDQLVGQPYKLKVLKPVSHLPPNEGMWGTWTKKIISKKKSSSPGRLHINTDKQKNLQVWRYFLWRPISLLHDGVKFYLIVHSAYSSYWQVQAVHYHAVCVTVCMKLSYNSFCIVSWFFFFYWQSPVLFIVMYVVHITDRRK